MNIAKQNGWRRQQKSCSFPANQSTVQEIVLHWSGAIPGKNQELRSSRSASGYLFASQLLAPLHGRSRSRHRSIQVRLSFSAARRWRRRENLVVTNTMPQTSRPTVIRDVNAPMSRVVVPASSKPTRIGRLEQKMSDKDMKVVLEVLCLTGENRTWGPRVSPARTALSGFLIANSRTASTTVTNNVFFDLRELRQAGKRSCS